jgi:RNA polymerase sigma-70 factor (ECF subfamily)
VSRHESTADEVLIRRVFREHGAALLAYATRLTGDRTRAEAVVQEVLIRVWRDPEALPFDKGAARAHLFTITRDLAAAGKDGGGASFDSMVVLSAMETLPSEHRDVLRALYFQGRGVAETAASLGVPAGAVKARSYHALRQLREAVR